MEIKKEIKPIGTEFDFTTVPSWYALCTNNACPLKADCLRYVAAQHAPSNLETATCVMPQTLHNDQCHWYDKPTIEVWAAGFSHLYDKVLKKDYTVMRKDITKFLHGAKLYYEYKRGERALSSGQQQWIRNYVKSRGYEWEVEFDSYFEAYIFHCQVPSNR
ncbi:MAG: hypothetical protein IJQ64_10360 [Prevotella sp.]|jgi:hypothetical protein|nr:hypothetical protein [Prevotella sp.]MBQ3313205.1 hypothetical protein [Prevotella sp.]MBQ6918182.1 hypothetical protein [Prevotella sp.]